MEPGYVLDRRFHEVAVFYPNAVICASGFKAAGRQGLHLNLANFQWVVELLVKPSRYDRISRLDAASPMPDLE